MCCSVLQCVLQCATVCVAVTKEPTILDVYCLFENGQYNECMDDYSEYLPCVAVRYSVCCSALNCVLQ